MEEVIELSRPEDGEAFCLIFTGGLRAARTANGLWRIEPLLKEGKPCVTGLLTIDQLQSFSRQNEFKPIAFSEMVWHRGVYYSSWDPIIPGKKNHSESPAGLWSNISGNLSRSRSTGSSEEVDGATIANNADSKGPIELLSGHINLSLQSLDMSVEQIAEHYHEQLVNHLITGNINGERLANTQGQALLAHVHSFFLHLGAARDYLSALVAHRLGLDHEKIDSMARLVARLRESLPNDDLLQLLFREGYVSPDPDVLGKYLVAGWMKDVTSLRNELIHRRPYGSRFDERFGWIAPKGDGVYRYVRHIIVDERSEMDLLDTIKYHYSKCTDLFFKAAEASGSNTAAWHIAEADVISLRRER